MAFNHRRKSSSIFNTQVFLLDVMFTIEISSSRNKTLSLHSKSDPVVINPSSKLPQTIHDWSIVNNQLFTSTIKSLLWQWSLRFNIQVSFEQAAFLSTLNSLLQRLVFALSLLEGCAQTTYNFWINRQVLVWTSRLTNSGNSRSSMRVVVKTCSFNISDTRKLPSFKSWNVFFLKIQRDLCRPKSFDTFEKRAPGLLAIWTLNL